MPSDQKEQEHKPLLNTDCNGQIAVGYVPYKLITPHKPKAQPKRNQER